MYFLDWPARIGTVLQPGFQMATVHLHQCCVGGQLKQKYTTVKFICYGKLLLLSVAIFTGTVTVVPMSHSRHIQFNALIDKQNAHICQMFFTKFKIVWKIPVKSLLNTSRLIRMKHTQDAILCDWISLANISRNFGLICNHFKQSWNKVLYVIDCLTSI